MLSDLIASSGAEQSQHTIFFWRIGRFCEQYFYIPALIPIIIVVCPCDFCERAKHIKHFNQNKHLVLLAFSEIVDDQCLKMHSGDH